MKIYTNVLIWAGGVLAPTVTEVTAAILTPHLKGHDAIAIKQKYSAAANILALGQISSAEYCEKAIGVSKSSLTPLELERKILEKLVLDPSATEILAKIPPQYKIWRIVDLPEDWYSELRTRSKIDASLPESQTILTQNLGLTAIVPYIFYALPLAIHQSMADCITVDADYHRAMESMRHGLASIIYVYPDQVKVQLALQGIYPTGSDVMHPATGGRVKI